jgi:P4 family phage/plasmid primase-like protien
MFEQFFPENSLNKYMWNHLASTLIGENINQTFNIYLGSGSNGKSILIDLMSKMLGDYKGTVPITLVTEKRNSIGGTSSEIMQLKGLRLAVMQEPSKDAKINEGIMKELTGGDPIQARGLYAESEVFNPQFQLVVCTNNLPEINSNDNGTWRRIRICDFVSKFVDKDDGEIDANAKYHFPKDKKLKDKLPKLAPTFASMLVELAFQTNGLVEDCDTVLASSNKYRKREDMISAFLNERFERSEGQNIYVENLRVEIKDWFQSNGKKPSKFDEIADCMDKKFQERETIIIGQSKDGKPREKKGWKNVAVIKMGQGDDLDNI